LRSTFALIPKDGIRGSAKKFTGELSGD
jgi:hypothetical protein